MQYYCEDNGLSTPQRHASDTGMSGVEEWSGSAHPPSLKAMASKSTPSGGWRWCTRQACGLLGQGNPRADGLWVLHGMSDATVMTLASGG